MTTPISSVSGLASGIQWSGLIQQIVQLDSQRQLTPLQNQQTADTNAVGAWATYESAVSGLDTAAQAVAQSTALAGLTTSVGTSASGRTLFTATAAATATPGTYNVEVDQLAAAEKVSGSIVATGANTALGVSGTFSISGQTVTIAATDTLANVRDKINAVNTGATPSGVSAAILTSNNGAARLILTSQNTGAAGIQLVDGTSDQTGVLTQLGFTDGGTAISTSANGAAQSYDFATSTQAVATAVGVPAPATSTVTIGGVSVSVDLSTDTLASIAAKINAAGGNASVSTETIGTTTESYLSTAGAVSASTADGQRALEMLGLVRGTRGAVQQSAVTGTALTQADGTALTTGTLLTNTGNGASAGVQAGDTFTISGTRADGTAVKTSFTVGASSTVNDLLTALSSAFGTPARPVTATLDNGEIRLTDTTGGDSQLAFTLSANNEGGGTLNFGTATVDTVGRQREVVAGADAQVRVDGVLIQRPTNTISDAISGLTLNLQAAEQGSPVALTVSRDTTSALTAVQNLATAYNAVVDATSSLMTAGQPLADDGALRSATESLTSSLLSNVIGTSGTYTNPVVAGVSLDKNGHLQVDATAFQNALNADPAGVSHLFSTTATASSSSLVSPYWSSATQPGTYTVNVTQAATTASTTGSVLSSGYSAVGASDAITVNDATSGSSVTVALNNGDSVDTMVANLNAQFTTQKLNVVASNVGGALSLTGTVYGAGATFAVSYSDPSIATQLGIAQQSYAGTDVQGNFVGTDVNGNQVTYAATGSGRLLTGGASTPVDGLAVTYTGTSTGSAGTINFVLGVAGNLQRAAYAIDQPGNGLVALQTSFLQQDSSDLDTRISAVQTRLAQEQATLTARFTQMETVLAHLQAQGSFLTNMLSAGTSSAAASSAASSSTSSSNSSGSGSTSATGG
jgi:flagellar hook-associated protein 2